MIRVLLADDQQLVRSGFRLILSMEDDISVVGEASDGADAIAKARELRPDVILMDVQMPGTDGIEATRSVVAEGHAKVIILTTFDRDDYLFDALSAGASGFLLKNADPDSLAEAVRAAADGHALLAPEVTMRVIGRVTSLEAPATQRPEPPAELGLLTAREREVLLLIGEGLSNNEIARRLYLTEATVKTHVSACLAKLQLRDRVQTVVYIHRHGLLPAGPTNG
ncbi:DNA-binding NarL/FixJ family response regulator [Nocardioides luteus]|uniref:DNA-binding response regulator n=1 Tax=Nocardioides luteus TaxID=1844 RepID=A0ABQ5T1A7_9ACTN|nr:response regulator transcription factor [Nocardioides luteus]MDR7310951.1 DNA-binding NarL/FixJ family response regulator [Nocardioides luteus]GGR39548.1 DNA-binding response regulator [Nocardioides luteus]GLJ69269.1 DNA-binding response regulator [Nocardioides luteus]